MAEYFGTNGIRGDAELLTPEFVSSMCRAFAKCQAEVHDRGQAAIMVGRDTRVSGEMLEKSAVAGILSFGIDVIRLGVVPSPVVEFNTRKGNVLGAVIITASHNPPMWNGLKFLDHNGVGLSKERGGIVERTLRSVIKCKRLDAKNRILRKNPFMDYIEAITKAVDMKKIRERRLRVVLDCANGTCSLVAPELLKRLGCEVTTLNANVDGTFPGRESEPTKDNVTDLMESVRATGADAGIAFDGDGDRVIFIDENGEYIIGDRGFALAVKLMLEKKRGKVVTTVATTNAVRDVCRQHGCKLELTKVGGPYISEKIIETGAIIGGEEVGGVVWPEVHYGKDGMITAIKVIESLCARTLSESIAELPEYYNAKLKIVCGKENKDRVILRVKERLKDENLVTLDGIRIDHEDGWCIIRASGTEDYIRIFAEAGSQSRAKALLSKYEKIVTEIIGERKG